MRQDQRVNYAERIDRAIRLIEARAADGEAPSLAELAAAAALSEYHFHRMFRLMTSESPGEAVTRVRLAASLPGLDQGSLSEATGRSGYATSQSYARALRASTGASPGELSGDPVRLADAAKALARPARSAGDTPLTIEVVTLEPLRLMALRNVGAYEELNAGYGQLFEQLMAQLGPEAIEGIYGLPEDDPRCTPAEACRFTCAFDTGTSGEPAGVLEELHLPGGRCAAMTWQGDFGLIHPAIDALYAWAAETGEAIAAEPLFIHYLDDPDEVPPEDQRAVVYLQLVEGMAL